MLREVSAGAKTEKNGHILGLYTLCFCFSTNMLHVNPPFFLLKWSVVPQKVTKILDDAHHIDSIFKARTSLPKEGPDPIANEGSNRHNEAFFFINSKHFKGGLRLTSECIGGMTTMYTNK